MAYNGTIELIDGMKPKNNGTYPLIDAKDVYVDEGVRLDTAQAALGGGNEPDATLTVTGRAADAKAAGDRLAAAEADLTELLKYGARNLLRFTDREQTSNGVTWTVDEGTITADSGNASAATKSTQLAYQNPTSLPDGIEAGNTYYLHFNQTGTGAVRCAMAYYAEGEAEPTAFFGSFQDSQVAIPSEAVGLEITFSVDAGSTVDATLVPELLAGEPNAFLTERVLALSNMGFAGIDLTVLESMISFVEQIAALLPQITYTSNNNNSTAAISAAESFISALENGMNASSNVETLVTQVASLNGEHTGVEIRTDMQYIPGFIDGEISQTNGSLTVTDGTNTLTLSAPVTYNLFHLESGTQRLQTYRYYGPSTPDGGKDWERWLDTSSSPHMLRALYSGSWTYYQDLYIGITAPGITQTFSAGTNKTIEISGAGITSGRYYAITNAAGCTLSNSAKFVVSGANYTTNVTLSSNAISESFKVTMGGTDITSLVWNQATSEINIAAVTGNVDVSVAVSAQY